MVQKDQQDPGVMRHQSIDQGRSEGSFMEMTVEKKTNKTDPKAFCRQVFELNNKILEFLVAQRLKCLPGMQETRVRSLGWEDPPGEGNGNPLQYSCLENPMEGGAWQATVHGVAKSRTQLSDFTFFQSHYMDSRRSVNFLKE